MNVTAVKHNKLALTWLQLFRNVDLDAPALDGLLSQCNYRRISAGETLLSPGTHNHYLYVIISGRFGIRLGPGDEQIPLTAAEPGECVGEMSFFDSRLPSTQVFATEDSLVLQIEQQVLWRMVSSSHELAATCSTSCLNACATVTWCWLTVLRCSVCTSILRPLIHSQGCTTGAGSMTCSNARSGEVNVTAWQHAC